MNESLDSPRLCSARSGSIPPASYVGYPSVTRGVIDSQPLYQLSYRGISKSKLTNAEFYHNSRRPSKARVSVA